jgi:hypothetical protein
MKQSGDYSIEEAEGQAIPGGRLNWLAVIAGALLIAGSVVAAFFTFGLAGLGILPGFGLLFAGLRRILRSEAFSAQRPPTVSSTTPIATKPGYAILKQLIIEFIKSTQGSAEKDTDNPIQIPAKLNAIFVIIPDTSGFHQKNIQQLVKSLKRELSPLQKDALSNGIDAFLENHKEDLAQLIDWDALARRTEEIYQVLKEDIKSITKFVLSPQPTRIEPTLKLPFRSGKKNESNKQLFLGQLISSVEAERKQSNFEPFLIEDGIFRKLIKEPPKIGRKKLDDLIDWSAGEILHLQKQAQKPQIHPPKDYAIDGSDDGSDDSEPDDSAPSSSQSGSASTPGTVATSTTSSETSAQSFAPH